MASRVIPIKILPPIMFFIPLAAGLLLHFFWKPLIFSPNSAILLLGGLLVLAGAVLSFWAKRTFSTHNVQPRFTPVPNLVTTGPFAFTRNPLYISLILVYLGICLAANSIWPLILMPLPVVYLYYNVILLEEKYLESEFGKDYLDYKNKVRRWL